MGSIARTFAVRKEGLTEFLKPETPCYNNGTNDVLFPFSYSNNVLDISYEGNNFETQFSDTGATARAESDTQVSILGGPYLATSLGENFKTYIRNWRAGTIDAGSPINVYIAPQLIKVQEADIENITANSSFVYNVSTSAPSSDNYISGNVSNNYQTTYVFKTPLTFTTVEGGVINYITFRTNLDQE
jgi:hypothetical protein